MLDDDPIRTCLEMSVEVAHAIHNFSATLNALGDISDTRPDVLDAIWLFIATIENIEDKYVPDDITHE